jgi:uncharacterized protein (TIGR02118 family)
VSERLAVAVWRDAAVTLDACRDHVVDAWVPSALDAANDDGALVVDGLTVSFALADQGRFAHPPDAHGSTPNVDVFAIVDLVRAHDLDDLPARDLLHRGARRVEVWRITTREPKLWERTWADGEAAPGLKMVSFMQRAEGLTHEQFARHWTERHAPLALEHHPGLWNYRQHVVRRAFTPGGDAVDGIAELHFRSRDDFETKFFGGEASKRAIFDDVARFMGPPSPETALMTELPVRSAFVQKPAS